MPKLNPLVRLLVTGLLSYEDDQWAKHRRIISPAFHQEKLKLMLPAFYASFAELVSRWNKLTTPKGSCELDIWPEIQNVTTDVISRALFGSGYEEGQKIFQLQNELSKLTLQVLQSVYIPGFRFLPTKKNNRMKEIEKEIQTVLTGIINKKEATPSVGEVSSSDLLSLLIDSNKNYIQEHGSKKNAGMTIKEVIEECKLFYFAGQETTSNLLVWTMVVLSMHMDWQTRAREEVLKFFGNDIPSYGGLSHLKIVTMILYEVLRLYPPTVTIGRSTYKNTKLGEISLPPGVHLEMPILLLHHDLEFWGEDAQEFKPERFAEGVSKATNNQVSFFPFGWGPRICIGQNFAMTEAKMALAMILQHFSFELSPSYTHAPCFVLTLQPQYGAQIIFHKLEHASFS
ncbi:PREDICTED: cytochrome P450 CYP72A219-like isoform X2 [Nelumbo nucifera]|nr:PREDICTED: cytochrome P450 CYP72A219-like isoform X2 [Nelumbo nucifera]XP_019055470.1 PREDICTED: cytochrome P450 CYP72A219-like isoform X2 [Nelumbo nucifera]